MASDLDKKAKAARQKARAILRQVGGEFIVDSFTEVAAFFGRSTAAIEKWRADGMPGERGRWDLSQIAKWQMDRKEKRSASAVDIDDQLKASRIDLVEAQTDKIRAKLTTEAEAAFSMRCNALVGHLTALANRYRQRDMVDALEMLNVTLDAARE